MARLYFLGDQEALRRIQQGGPCSEFCKRDERAAKSDEEYGTVQRKAATQKIPRAASSPSPSRITAPPMAQEVLRSEGQPLDTTTREFFEPRFGEYVGPKR